MASVKCSASGCKNTDQGGKIFYQCSACGRWWCSDHATEGKQCVCKKGYLRR